MRSLRGPGGAGRWASRRGRVSSDIFSTGLQGAVGLSCYRRRAPLRVTCRHARTATSDRLPQVATPEWVVGRGQFATDLGDNHELGGVIGGGLAISHATETDWLTHMSLSGLGMDTGASGILNTTLVALGLILVALAISLEGTFAGLCSAGRLSPRAHRLLSVGFVATGGAVVVAGLFHNDGQPSHLIHSLASFVAPMVLAATILGCRLAVGDLGRRFDRLSVAILVVSVGLFVAAYPAHLVPYALMELICFASIGARIWLLAARLQHVTCQLSQRQSVTSQGSGARIGWPDVLGCTGAQPARDRLSIRRW